MSAIPNFNWNSWQDPEQVAPYGTALVSGGLCVQNSAFHPIGPLSFGFLWGMNSIWFNSNFYDGVSTSWASDFSAESISTVWSSDFAAESISTTWTPDPNFTVGSYQP